MFPEMHLCNNMVIIYIYEHYYSSLRILRNYGIEQQCHFRGNKITPASTIDKKQKKWKRNGTALPSHALNL